MLTKKTLVAVLTASTFLTTGAAFAQSPSPTHQSAQQPQTAQQKMAEKDFSKLSTQGSKAFQDLALTRLAIFDGRVKDAKTFVNEADTAFGKAKNDETVFTKAEADLKSRDTRNGQSAETGSMRGNASANEAAGGSATENGRSASNGASNAVSPQDTNGASGPKSASNANGASNASSTSNSNSASDVSDMKKPIQWLPVDGEISISDNFTANAQKAAAVADANKSLAKGDRKGALDKLKLADVNLDIVLAVVPVKKTVNDVHQAAQMIDSGKYYEASQLLRKVQDSARFDVAEIVGVPTKGTNSDQSQTTQHNVSGSAATH